MLSNHVVINGVPEIKTERQGYLRTPEKAVIMRLDTRSLTMHQV